MTCPACGHAVEAGAKFCSECGRLLNDRARPAPLPRSYTPAHLAQKILSSRTAVQGERKQVTVLFADVKGSMELAEQVETETWYEILDRFFAILADGIHRVEGVITQYMGDGVMALFGAPIAHEDHAQRACHAALALRGELRRYADALRLTHGLSFSVRMGLNSGEVVVGRIGDDLRMDYTAQGHAVGLAARMEQLAEPGTVLLTAHTAELVSGFFALRDLGSARIKGVAEPLHVFELRGPGPLRTRLDRARARGFASFVGRGEEMAALDTALEQALRGAGAVVGVEGDAGVGKSRLCAEFVTRCRTRGVSVYEAHCPAHGRTVPFLPILALLRSYFGIGERDGAGLAREKIAGRLLVRDDSARDALPVLYEFLGVADPAHPAPRMDPEARQRQLFAFVRGLVDARRPDETVLLFIDDLHWIDPASEAFVAQLVDAVPNTRTLLLVNYRPEYVPAWSGGPAFQHLALSPLTPAAAGALLDELLGADAALAPLRELIHQRTGGNPFFIEEVVQALLSDGTLARQATGLSVRRPITDIRIPDTVHAVLAARIDQLVEGDKAVLQTAAVVGKVFDSSVLRRVLEALPQADGVEPEAAVRRLGEAGLIVEQSGGSDDALAFKHPLTQEVAYRSQLAARRELVHRAVATVLQELHADKLDEVAALLAHHWEHAGATLDAAGWHRRAAEWTGVSDMAAAVRHWQRVRELVDALPESPERLDLRMIADIRLLNFGWRSGMSPAEAETLFSEGRALAERRGDTTATAGFLNTYGIVVGMSGEVDRGLALVSEAARLALGTGEAALKLVTTVALVQAQTMAGTLADAHDTLAQTLAVEPHDLGLGKAATGFSPFLYLLMMRGYVRTEMGQLRDAESDLARVLSMTRERGEVELLGWAHEFAAYLALAIGAPDRALEHAARSLTSAEKIGSPLSLASACYSMGAAQVASGRWAESIATSQRGLAIIRASNTGRHWESRGLALLAEGLAGAGEREQARRMADEAEATSLRGGNRALECFSCLAIARARRLADGGAERNAIEATLARLETLATSNGAQLYAAPLHEERAALAAALGNSEAQRRELDIARRLFTAMGADGHVARLPASATHQQSNQNG
jgi:class 3 adenylate cyclase/tetratricopeptide (TPR) repeat protein